jgi:uncharacterized delta-60 repeat protein/uncharacterized repeat protein (TIGR01451 family)
MIGMGVLLMLFTAGHALAQGGCLDPSFGSAGKVTTNFTTQNDEIFAIALQTDGKIVAAGTAGRGPALRSSIALARYNPDGSLDPSFGVGGKVSTKFSGDEDWATSLALQPDGRIVVAGGVGIAAPNYDSAVVRYLSDGSLDASFGVGGLVTIDFDGQQDAVVAVALQADGKILTLNGIHLLSVNPEWALVRYLPDGTLDASFGGGGRVITDIGPQDDRPAALTLQPDGKILAGGLTLAGAHNQIALARYDPDGALDPTFGTAGIVTTAFPDANAGAFDLAVLPSGEILVGGSGPGAGDPDFGDLLLARYLSDGTLDASFGTGGYVLTDVNGSTDNGITVAVTPDGKILLAGQAWGPNQGDFALVRYHADGSRDTSFGVDGKVVTDFFTGNDGAAAVLLLGDGRMVLGGEASESPDDFFAREFALARYLPISCPDLGVTLSDAPDPATVGQDVIYTANVTNYGPGEATDVALADTLAGAATLGSVAASQGTCATAGPTVDCSLGTLASGAVATVTIVVVPSALGLISDTATVTAEGADPNPANDSASETTSVTNRPPRCDLALPSPGLLWPPNHRLNEVWIHGVGDPDGDPVALTITGITQDEPTRSNPGDPSPDGFGVGTSHAWLRAERDGSGNGRVYGVSFSAQDGQGGACSGEVAAGVPHDRHLKPIDDGQIYDSTAP